MKLLCYPVEVVDPFGCNRMEFSVEYLKTKRLVGKLIVRVYQDNKFLSNIFFFGGCLVAAAHKYSNVGRFIFIKTNMKTELILQK